MRTPPLRRRVTALAVSVVAGLFAVVGGVTFVAVQHSLEASLDELLRTRAEVAVDVLETHEPAEAADRLVALGVPALIVSPDGAAHTADPVSPRLGSAPPSPLAPGVPHESHSVRFADGTTVEVYASRAGVEHALRRLLTVLVLGTAGGVATAFLALRHLVGRAMAPLREVAATAERIAAGGREERLLPDRPATELGRMTDSFDRMVEALESAIDRAEGEEERTRRFLADAAHQLRTPLAGIRASVELLLQEPDPEIRDRLLANTIRETARAARLITDLLHVARLDQGRPLREVATDLLQLGAEEVERARELSPYLEVRLAAPEPPPAPVLADPDELREALANLVDNARRHANEEVTVELARVDGRMEIRVSDDGPGVAPEAVDLVFERFATLDGQDGSGLGLPIAHAVARAHGGDVRYEDGSFVLHVPAREADHGLASA